MASPDIASTAQHLNEVARQIDDLPADQAAGELHGLLDGNVHDSLVRRMIDDGEAARDADSPAFDVLRSIETALGKVPDPDARTALGSKAVHTIISSMDGLAPYAHVAGLRLVGQADRLADLIQDPRERALEHRNISYTAMEVATSETIDSFYAPSYVDSANANLERAATAAKEIQGPFTKSYALTLVAETAVDNLSRAANNSRVEDSVTASRLINPGFAYQRALTAAENIQDPAKRHGQNFAIALSMARSAAKIGQANPDLAKQLFEKAIHEISEVTRAYYGNGELDNLPKGQKCHDLAQAGAQLARVIREDYKVYDKPTGKFWLRNGHDAFRLANRAAHLFEVAGSNAQTISQRPFFGRLISGDKIKRVQGAASFAQTAASRLIDIDFSAGKQILTAAVDLGIAEDQTNNLGRASESLRWIGELADRQDNAEQEFKLRALGHQLAERLDDNQALAEQTINAGYWLWRPGKKPPRGDLLVLDHIDRPFAAFLVDYLPTSRATYEDARYLAGHLADPDLKKAADAHAATLAAEQQKRQEEQRPRTPIARQADELFGK